MAYKMKLNAPYKGMPFVWNLSSAIGPLEEERNNKTDVELFQNLIRINTIHKPSQKPLRSTIAKISVNGIMDAVTGLYVYHAAYDETLVTDARRISPAKNGNASYGDGRLWTIVYLNYRLFSLNRAAWESLPESCSPMLKQELLTKTGV
jgi:hypothetical protein